MCVCLLVFIRIKSLSLFVSFYDTATTEIYTSWHTLSLHDALPIYPGRTDDNSAPIDCCKESRMIWACRASPPALSSMSRSSRLMMKVTPDALTTCTRSEEHTSELQSLMRISYAVFCLKKKKTIINIDIQ